jgi:hypothetical protein
MSLWIKILGQYLVLLLILSEKSLSCSLTPKEARFYSLSGPVTIALKELGLLKDPKLKGLSLFHPVSKNEFSGRFLPGGIFLSRSLAQEMEGAIIFFDESRELARMLSKMKVTAKEVKTRGLTPIEVMNVIIQEIKEQTMGCEAQLSELQSKTNKVAQEVLKLVPKNFGALFFLGELGQGKAKYPEMVIVNDGAVKWLRKEQKLSTYPSDLAYVSWSAKVLSLLPPSYLKVGVIDSGSGLVKSLTKLSSREINLKYPGALIPGLSELEAWLYLLQGLP